MLLQAAALVAACVLLFPSFGPMGVYHLQKKSIRREVKKQILQGIELSELARFRAADVTADKVRWIHSGEFVIDGFYYDVVRWVDTDSGRVVYCWPDHAESELERMRTEIAMSLLAHKRGERPSEFLSYVVFIKGFFKDDWHWDCAAWLPSEVQFPVISVSESLFGKGLFQPPERSVGV